MADTTPVNVMVLGASGFIGRNVVHYLVSNDLCEHVTIVDKVLPETAYLNEDHAASFASDKVDFRQANLANEGSIERAFNKEPVMSYTYVINCAANTKYGQVESVYEAGVLGLSVKCAQKAAELGVQRFIEISTSQVYDGNKKIKDETGATDPWTHLATYKLQAEEALLAMDNIEVIIVRPAVCYGPGDVMGLMPRIIVAAVYKELGEKMQMLWTKDMRLNTVHVTDVATALWHLCLNGQPGEIYNLADKNDTTQRKVNILLEAIFGIETKFAGSIKSNLAKLNLAAVTEDVNDKHLKPWSDLCSAAGIDNTPLTPYLDQELLYNNWVSVNGEKIESTGFEYQFPELTEDLLREQIDYYTSQGIFPESVLE